MKLNRYDRLQSVDAFLNALKGDRIGLKPMSWLLPLVLVLVVALGIFGWYEISDNDKKPLLIDSLCRVNTIPVMPVTSLLYVNTYPTGATIYLDDKKVGESPLEGKEISHGNHTVKLVLDGYEPFSKKYTFGDRPVIINENLVAMRTPVREQSSNSISSKVSAATSGIINGHAWVDLGLSVKWATMNVGANTPSDYGDYFAWGEIHPKSQYTEENSIMDKKYDIWSHISGNFEYDAACYHWGDTWRLPTKQEFEELVSKCSWSWTNQNNHNGYMVTGINGNKIFLPAAGYRSKSSVGSPNIGGHYWSASPDPINMAYFLRFLENMYKYDVSSSSRRHGGSVRPVSD